MQLALILFLVGLGQSAFSAKLDLYFGAFDFSAETAEAADTISGLGVYKISYLLPITSHVEVGLGYSLVMSDTFGGDSSFGFDVESAWFPWTLTEPIKIRSDKTSLRMVALWRRFLSLGYNVRQFQSVETQFTGFSVGVGAERALRLGYDLKFLLRHTSLSGPNDATASEIDALAGVSFSF